MSGAAWEGGCHLSWVLKKVGTPVGIQGDIVKTSGHEGETKTAKY